LLPWGRLQPLATPSRRAAQRRRQGVLSRDAPGGNSSRPSSPGGRPSPRPPPLIPRLRARRPAACGPDCGSGSNRTGRLPGAIPATSSANAFRRRMANNLSPSRCRATPLPVHGEGKGRR
jgi:hypothetical protein